MSLYIGKDFSGLEEYTITDVAYGNGVTIVVGYITVGSSELIYKVDDGTWEYLSTALYNPTSIEFCFDRFLIKSNNSLHYSFDGFTWIQVTALGTSIHTQFGYINGRYFLSTYSGSIITYYYTEDFVTFTTVTFPAAPIGVLQSFPNVLAFIPVNGYNNDTARLVYTLDGVTWLYKTTDTLYAFLPYDFSKHYIPTRSKQNIPGTFNYKAKWFNNNLLVNDGITDCNTYTSTIYEVPLPSSSDLFVFNGINIVMLSNLKFYSLNENGYSYIGNLLSTIPNHSLIKGFRYLSNTYYIYGTGFCIYSIDLIVWNSVSPGLPSGIKDILVATRESKSIIDIKNTNPRDCEFHSDLPYINIKVYEAESIIDADILYYSGYIYDFYSGHTYGCAVVNFPEEFYSNYLDRLIIVVANDTELSKAFRTLGLRNGSLNDIPGSVGHKWINTNFAPSSGITYVYNQSTAQMAPSSNYKNLLVPKIASTSNRNTSQPYTLPNVKLLVVTNVTKNGEFIPYYQDDSGVKINSNSIYINGYDLYNTKYLSNLALSPGDTEIDTEGGKVYILGDVPEAETGMQLISSPANGTRIIKGSRTLFDTLYGKRGTYLDPTIIDNTYSFGAYYGTANTYEYELFSVSTSLLNSNAELNVLLELSITSTNIKHNETIDVIAAPDWVYYNVTKTFGSMFITLRDSTPVCIGVDEYYYYVFDPNRTKNFRFCEGYIVKTDSAGLTKIKLVFNTNVGYLNPSANMSVVIKARVLI